MVRVLAVVLAALVLAAAFAGAQESKPGAGAKLDFARDVLPLLEANCFKCHAAEYKGRARKPKGDFRMDGKSWLLIGAASGPAIVPGKPERSPLYTRAALPEDHDDVMPPSGEVLADADLAKLRRWIQEGASFGAWTGAGFSAPAVKTDEPDEEAATATDDESAGPSRFELYTKLAGDLRPAPTAAIKKAEEAGATVTPVTPDSPLLRIEYPSEPARATDEALRALAGLKHHIAILGLGRTALTDRALKDFGKLPRLVRLDLQNTAVTDKGLALLAAGKPAELRRLNLYGTAVTDKGLKELHDLPNLTMVYLWQTKTTPAGREALQAARRGCRIVGAPTLPEAAPDRPQNNRRRR